MGFAAGGVEPAIPKIPLNLALLNERQILGVTTHMGPAGKLVAGNMEEVLGMIVSGKLKPRLPTVLPLDRFLEGFDKIVQRQVIGKIMLDPTAAAEKPPSRL